MNHLIESKLSYTSAKNIEKITFPLSKLGINAFVHDITFGKGQISLLTDRKEIYEFYYKTSYPAVCTNEEGRLLGPGIYLDRTLQSTEIGYAALISNVKNHLQFKHLLHFAENDDDCQHLYSFASNLDEENFLHRIINNIEKIKLFVLQHKKTNKALIEEIKRPKNRFSLPFNYDTKKVRRIYCSDNQYHLSKREQDCLKLTIRGKSAKQVANELGLSRRTVEEYLNNIKSKLGVFSKSELIDKVMDYLLHKTNDA